MIKRRRLVALVSVVVLLIIGLVVFGTGLVITRTSYGQDQLRRLLQSQLTAGIRGKVYVGPISGGFLTGVTVDSFAIRDADNDSLFISTGRITASYDPRDLIDKRVWLRDVEIEHPVMYVRQHVNGRWNFKEIFRGYDKKSNVPKPPGRNFGDFVVIDSVRVHDASFVLQMPWMPDDSLRGAKRDSAIRYNLARKDKEIVRVIDEGKPSFVRTWRWRHGYAVSSHMRLADPDSDKVGRIFVIDTLHVVENDPPFRLRNIRGSVRHLGDSIWIDVPHFDLPQSTGSAKGKIVWGSDLPIRYDVAVRGDSVALNDVSWVYPTLPTTGGGSVSLHIVNERDNLRVIDYKLSSMDVRSTGSHLVGDMTFAVGGPILAVKDVKMSAQPMDFDLLRTLNGRPFPVDWRGQLYGSVRARGGPLTHFYVDEGEALFQDAHVRGAVSRVGGHGELDILQPALTAFHRFDVNAASVDLRSIEFLFPNFPRLGGTIAGKATLDSSWLDVRFSDADVLHHDGPGEPSHVTGNGRVTWGEKYMSYDVDLQAQPLSLGMLARSYPKMPFTGLVSGPIKAKGTAPDLQLVTSLQGVAGALTFDGRVDIDPPGYGARGTGQFTGLSLHHLLDPARVSSALTRPAVLTGRYDVAVNGDSLGNLDGAATVDVTRADIDGLRVFPSTARLRFAERRLFVDTLRLETTAATILAHGALGLPHGASDSLQLTAIVDSLGGLRRYLAVSSNGDGAAGDTLIGSLRVSGVATGRIDSLDVHGGLEGSGLRFGKDRGRKAVGSFALRNLLAEPAGTVTLRVDTLTLAGVLLDSIAASVQMESRSRAAFTLTAESDNGPKAQIAGSVASTGGEIGSAGATTRLTLDTTTIDIAGSRWHLLGPSHITRDPGGVTIDSLVLASGAGGRLAVRGAAPLSAPVALGFRADSVALEDFGVLAQMSGPLGGYAWLNGQITGTREEPVVGFRSEIRGFSLGGVHVERTVATGNYANRSFDVAMDLYRNRVPALHTTVAIPVRLALFGLERSDAPIRGSLRADSADLAIVEMVSGTLQRASGRLTANVDIVASKDRRSINGVVAVRDGDVQVQNLGIRLRDLNGAIRFDGAHDSVQADLRAWSGVGPSSRVRLKGFVSYANWDDPRFNLALYARSFRALDKKSLATLDVSTGEDSIRLSGRMTSAALTGTLNVNRGTIALPERDLARKNVVDLSGDELFQIIDSSDVRARPVMTDVSSRLLKGLRYNDVKILIGDEVWLRSRAANIKLSGSLNVRSAEVKRTFATSGARNGAGNRSDAPDYVPALEGELLAERGTYTLDLGPVQRDFDVQRGTITYFGSADNNPYVDITATHNVKRANQPDLVISVRLLGPLTPNPSIELSSNESYLSTSDLVSYLVTGQPTFALNANAQQAVQQASLVLLPTLTAYAASRVRSSGIGSWVDLLQLQGGGTQLQGLTSSAAGTSFRDYLFGARLGGEKQISNNLFFSFSAGLCSLNQKYLQENNLTAAGSFVDALGGKLEYRFNPQLSVQAGSEPPTAALYCGRSNLSLGSVVSTPRQWGLSFLRSWHF